MVLLSCSSASGNDAVLVLRHEVVVLRHTQPTALAGLVRSCSPRRADPAPAGEAANAPPGHARHRAAEAPSPGHPEKGLPAPGGPGPRASPGVTAIIERLTTENHRWDTSGSRVNCLIPAPGRCRALPRGSWAAAVFAYGCGRAGCPVVGCGLVGRRSGAAGGRVDGCCRAAAAPLQRGIRHRQRPRGTGRGRPVGDDARVPDSRCLRCHDGAGAKAGRLTRAADPDRRRCRRHARRGEPRTCRGRRFVTARVLGGGRLCGLDGLAGWGPAAGAFGALGTAVGYFSRCRRGAAMPAGLVRRGAHHRRRTGRPGGAGPGRGAGGMAASGVSCRRSQSRAWTRPAGPVGADIQN